MQNSWKSTPFADQVCYYIRLDLHLGPVRILVGHHQPALIYKSWARVQCIFLSWTGCRRWGSIKHLEQLLLWSRTGQDAHAIEESQLYNQLARVLASTPWMMCSGISAAWTQLILYEVSVIQANGSQRCARCTLFQPFVPASHYQPRCLSVSCLCLQRQPEPTPMKPKGYLNCLSLTNLMSPGLWFSQSPMKFHIHTKSTHSPSSIVPYTLWQLLVL